jgi:hypothetical protein
MIPDVTFTPTISKKYKVNVAVSETGHAAVLDDIGGSPVEPMTSYPIVLDGYKAKASIAVADIAVPPATSLV